MRSAGYFKNQLIFWIFYDYNSLISACYAKCANFNGSETRGNSGLRIFIRNAFLVMIFLLYFSADSPCVLDSLVLRDQFSLADLSKYVNVYGFYTRKSTTSICFSIDIDYVCSSMILLRNTVLRQLNSSSFCCLSYGDNTILAEMLYDQV